MLDGLLGRGFSSKCKSLIKPTRTRIDVLRRREEATQRFLKGNLAQLLSNGLDINAFGRTEECLAGLNLLACYDFIEQSCEYISKKLSLMQKQRECPEECREAVGSLMFAAARFSDLPELRELRDVLQERYGSSLEHFVNQKLVERLALKPSTIEKKIQLLEDIASELSIKWDSRGFQQRMSNPVAPAQKQESIHDRDSTYNLCSEKETAVNSNRRDQLFKMKGELTNDRLRVKNGGENYLMQQDELDYGLFRGGESTGNNAKPHMVGEQNTPRRERGNHHMGRDELGYQLFRGGESNCNDGNSHMLRERNTCKRDVYDFKPRGGREKGELSSDKHPAKNGRENYLLRKDELDHWSSVKGESTGPSGKPHTDSECNTPLRENYSAKLRSRREPADDKVETTRINGKEDAILRRDRHGSSSCGKELEIADGLYNVPNNRVNGFDEHGFVSDEKPEELPRIRNGKIIFAADYMDYYQLNTAKSKIIHEKEGMDRLKPSPCYPLPPPYVKPKHKLDRPPYIKSNCGRVPVDPTADDKDDVEGVPERIQSEEDHSNFEDQCTGPACVRSQSRREKDISYRDNIPLPKPRSIRRKYSKSLSKRDDLGDPNDAEVVKRSSSSRRKEHHSRKGLQILFDDEHKQRDDEEKIIDKLLLHYSKKPSTYEQGKLRRKAKAHAPEEYQDGVNEGEKVALPARSLSLPSEEVALKEQVKLYARANSFQPDKPAGHVHPKLPDYDDLAAQFAALKGR